MVKNGAAPNLETWGQICLVKGKKDGEGLIILTIPLNWSGRCNDKAQVGVTWIKILSCPRRRNARFTLINTACVCAPSSERLHKLFLRMITAGRI